MSSSVDYPLSDVAHAIAAIPPPPPPPPPRTHKTRTRKKHTSRKPETRTYIHSIQTAKTALFALQHTPGAWAVVFPLLSYAGPNAVNVQIFGAHTAHAKVARGARFPVGGKAVATKGRAGKGSRAAVASMNGERGVAMMHVHVSILIVHLFFSISTSNTPAPRAQDNTLDTCKPQTHCKCESALGIAYASAGTGHRRLPRALSLTYAPSIYARWSRCRRCCLPRPMSRDADLGPHTASPHIRNGTGAPEARGSSSLRRRKPVAEYPTPPRDASPRSFPLSAL
ncbi:hypothetical protein DFH07DRAFT_966416 [Mycena maculata]|uniref:Uncharacterized protein n=1 Tax=Mycena maculata TaxID=230809 RepID=A0AAD7MYH0_9AGAR|nr:hypothetical protein DFH07DRAFT_966416 [Mycena maculata]